MKTGPKVTRYFAIQFNSDGRPCGWGLAQTRKAAVSEATRQYASHACYLGEKPGALKVRPYKLPESCTKVA